MAILVFCLMLASLAISQRVDKEIRCIRSFNFPPNTKCGVRGTLTNPKVLSDHVAKAPFESGDQLLQDCQDNCLDAGSKACKSFLVNRQTLRCRLFSDTIENMGFKPNTATSNPQFYSPNCIDQFCYTNTKTTLTNPDTDYDDSTFRICPPFPILFYGTPYACVDMGSNGVLSFSGPTTGFVNQPLPDVNQIPNRAIAVFWDDLFVEKKSVRVFPDQDMSWTFTNLAPNRVVSFEWKARVFGPASDSWAHFTLNFNADINQARIQYVHLAKTKGEGATVGMQDTYKGKTIQVSYNSPSLSPGDEIVFDMDTNTYTKANYGS